MMNRREVGEGFRAPRRISNCFKDRDEELSFFRDLKKREKDQVASLLQPVSEEFEANGNNGLYRMDSGGRKGTGLEFLAESGKNDFNWLKTPPATPLFPSLEMETNGQELVIQREIPIIQPLSRFAGNSEGSKTATNTSTSRNPNPKPPQRHKTPTRRPSISSLNDKINMKTAPMMNQKTNQNQTCTDKTKPAFTRVVKSTISRGAPPSVRPKIPGLSDEAPPNLRTANRPASATRGRPTNQNLSTPQKQEMNSKIRRQSCSPSVTRGRKLDTDGSAANQCSGVSRAQQGGNRGQVLGSQMVERFMNARISNVEDRQSKIKLNRSMNESSRISIGEERQAKIKLNGSLNESSGFGGLMSKNSLDMALKHKEFQRDSSNSRKHGMITGRKT